MTSSKDDSKVGYWLEDQIKLHLAAIQKNANFCWHQFTDSKAARNIVAAQPADFLIISNGRTSLLEAKASVDKPSLAKCKQYIRPAQIGQHKKWLRAGATSLFIYYCEIDDNVQIWSGRHILQNDDWSAPLLQFPIRELQKNLRGILL